ncbi:unnamed protein product, partial [Nesidiocoris tenuis]
MLAIQHNVRRSRTVMDEVMQMSLEEKADLLILQEPPVIQGKIPGISLVNRCCAVSETPRSAVVVLNPTIDVLLLHEYSTDSLVVVKIRSARLEFTVVAAYFSPNERHEALLGRLDHAVAALSSQKMLLAGDFNAWCTLWGSASDNVRGREVAVWAAGGGFVLLNRPESGPTFRGNRGNSFIDLSWASPDLADVCLAWDLSFDTGSNHGVIRVLLTGGRRTTEDLPAVRFNTRKARWAPFRADAANIMIDYQLEEQQREDDDVGKAVAGLEQALVTAAANTLPLKGHKKGRQVPWWSQDLARLRREMRAARRRMQAADSPEDRRAMNRTYVRQRKHCWYNTRRAPWRAFRAEVESRMIDYSLAEEGCALGGAGAVNDLQQVLLQAADLILDRRGTRGTRAPPWWNSDLDALRMQRNSSRRAWQRGADGRNSRALSSAWRSSSREFKRALRRAKRASWRAFVGEELNQDPWSVPYRVFRGRYGADNAVGELDVGGRPAVSLEEAGQHYLRTVFPVDDPETDTQEEAELRVATRVAPSATNMPPWTMEQLDLAIGCFGRNKAPGLDGLDMAMVKEAPLSYRRALLVIFNRALQTGEFPPQWKVASIKTLLKSPQKDPTDANSYRPISLLPVNGKILERLMLNSMEPALLASLHRHQFGCVPGRSTDDAIATAKNMVRQSTAKIRMLIFFDIAGAFNAVWWPCVLRRAQRLGLPSNLFRLLSSYLSGRRAELWFKNSVVSQDVSRGCPQGSVLGAAIWNLVFSELLTVLDANGLQA